MVRVETKKAEVTVCSVMYGIVWKVGLLLGSLGDAADGLMFARLSGTTRLVRLRQDILLVRMQTRLLGTIFDAHTTKNFQGRLELATTSRNHHRTSPTTIKMKCMSNTVS